MDVTLHVKGPGNTWQAVFPYIPFDAACQRPEGSNDIPIDIPHQICSIVYTLCQYVNTKRSTQSGQAPYRHASWNSMGVDKHVDDK